MAPSRSHRGRVCLQPLQGPSTRGESRCSSLPTPECSFNCQGCAVLGKCFSKVSCLPPSSSLLPPSHLQPPTACLVSAHSNLILGWTLPTTCSCPLLAHAHPHYPPTSAFCLLDNLLVLGLQVAPGPCGPAGADLHRVWVEARGTEVLQCLALLEKLEGATFDFYSLQRAGALGRHAHT